MKNILVFYPENRFNSDQLYKLRSAGNTFFLDDKKSFLAREFKSADVIAVSPKETDKKTSRWLADILEKSSQVKGLAINSSDGSFIDKDYCLKRGIAVSVIPEHTAQAEAEFIRVIYRN